MVEPPAKARFLCSPRFATISDSQGQSCHRQQVALQCRAEFLASGLEKPPPRHIATFLEPFWASQMVLISASICPRNHNDRSLQPALLTRRILQEISGNVCQRRCCEFTKSKSSFPVLLGTSFPSLACRQMGPCVSFWAMEYWQVWFMPLLGQASKNLLGNPTPSFFPPSLAFQPQAVENHKV